MTLLARDVSKRIEEEMDYPGQIKVNIIDKPELSLYNHHVFFFFL